MEKYEAEPSSFRDRNGSVFYGQGTVYRGLSPKAFSNWECLSSKSFYQKFLEKRNLVATEFVDPNTENLDPALIDNWAAFLKHQPIPFISYPYEWSFGMLKDAALLQLDLLLDSLDEDMILKDSSPYNIQWVGSNPNFIDIPSFEKLNPVEPWVGYRQFCQMFLYPLFFQAYKNVPYHPWLRGCIDGITPEQCNNLMSLRDIFRPGVFLHAYMHAKAQVKYNQSKKDIKKGLSQVGFNKKLIQSNVRGLKKLVQKLSWEISKSEWSNYTTSHSYSDSSYELKKDFVRGVASSRAWGLTWDLGCNTGEFTRILAEHAKYVISMDADHLAVEHFYQALKKEEATSILPLVVNVGDSSPNLGWRGLERKSLVGRGKPELTLCLALIHHLVISANIPVKSLIDWLSSLGTSLVIEFITKQDSMVEVLLRNKEDNYTDYEIEYFEQCLSNSFNITRRQIMPSGTRVLYFAENQS